METTDTAPAHPFGIDFGGSGIKGAPVDLATGEFASKRVRIPTPEGAAPAEVAGVVEDLLEHMGASSDAPVGITVPAVVQHGVVRSAANIDKSWIGVDADALFTDQLDRQVTVMNDADAAGFAEARYGAAAGQSGLVIITTLGTGIGSALVYDGVLVPNSELGHTSRSTATTRSHGRRTVRARSRSCPGRSGQRPSRRTTGPSRSCSHPTSSWSAVG